jgi:hypothetical protein
MLHDFSQSSPAQSRSAAHGPHGDEVARLLSRYPALCEIELARLINLRKRKPRGRPTRLMSGMGRKRTLAL